MRVLVAEDEKKISDSLKNRLSAEGYVPEIALDGETAWFKGSTEDYAAVILDIGLPRMDGLSILRKWRSEGNETPVLILSALGSWPERVSGIDAGADDYLVKPFQMEELLARLRALLRRSSKNKSTQITIGSISIDLNRKTASEDGMPVALSPLEFRLLGYLVHNSNRFVTREELATGIYESDQEPGSNAIEVLIGRLRRRFKGQIVQNKRGFGYKIADSAE